MIYKYLIAIG